MSVRFSLHLIAGFVLVASGGALDARAQSTSASTFRVFVRGVDAGIEEVTRLESPEGWTLRGSGKLRPPINLAVDYWEARYDRSWKPIQLTVNLTENANQWIVRTIVRGTTASSEVSQNGQTQRRTNTVATDTIVLPNLVFGAYEALAARLSSEKAGSLIPGFIAPQDSVLMTVDAVADEIIETPERKIAARRWTLDITGGTKLDMEVWTEDTRLLRVDIPGQMISVVRDDVASVSARIVTMARPNDEQVSIPANGFSLAATISRPTVAPEPPLPAARKSAPPRLPAIVLISGSTPSDRDEIVAGIPIFAQLANALADAGFLAVRYDERGVGQSGGRQESATLDDFAIDARSVVTYLAKRKDVDPKRISLIGYGEGGWIALLVAAQETRVATLSLVATPSMSGTELVLEQQRSLLQRNGSDVAAQQAAVEQQKRILDAVMTGKGWEAVTPSVRRQVDTPLYRSFLTFDPSVPIARTRQPLLVVQPMLDREVPPHHGEQLAQLARSRPRAKVADFAAVPGLNHLLASASTGETAEYGALPERMVSPGRAG